MIKAIQPANVAERERTAPITRKIRNAFKVRMGFINRKAASAIAGTVKIIIGFQVMVEFGNRNGSEAIKMAVRRSIASEE